MSISAMSSGYPIIQQSSKMANQAARDIQQAQTQSSSEQSTPNNRDLAQANNPPPESSSSSPPSKPDTINALLNLNQAQQYNRAGATVVQREQEMIGSMLDIRV